MDRNAPDLGELDQRLIRRRSDRVATCYDAAAVLQREIAGRMLERLQYIRLQPERVLDLGCATGHACAGLHQAYGEARIIAVDVALKMCIEAVAAAKSGWFGRRRWQVVSGSAAALPFADQTIDLVFANLLLHWCPHPDAVFRECQRVLRPGGLLMFSSLGPDSLRELRAAWSTVDAGQHVHSFTDLHDLGDALVRERFADPVMDVEWLTLTYPTLNGLVTDIRQSGAGNAATGRRRGLLGRRQAEALRAAYEQYRGDDGRLPATMEIVYGHAWASAEPMQRRESSGEVSIPLSGVRRSLRG